MLTDLVTCVFVWVSEWNCIYVVVNEFRASRMNDAQHGGGAQRKLKMAVGSPRILRDVFRNEKKY